jgi:RNA polymerase sigma-70 factor, ECF subfamily
MPLKQSCDRAPVEFHMNRPRLFLSYLHSELSAKDKVAAAAMKWLLELQGEPTLTRWEEFEAWLDADALHRNVFILFERLWRALTGPVKARGKGTCLSELAYESRLIAMSATRESESHLNHAFIHFRAIPMARWATTLAAPTKENSGILPADSEPPRCNEVATRPPVKMSTHIQPKALHLCNFANLKTQLTRVTRDSYLADDLLQDAVVTALQRLEDKTTKQRGKLDQYVYGVALTLLRNFRRKNKSALFSHEPLPHLVDVVDEARPSVAAEKNQWSTVIASLLKEMRDPRDREVLIRFYLHEEDRRVVCTSLALDEMQFNRVIFRARSSFRKILEKHGFGKADLLSGEPDYEVLDYDTQRYGTMHWVPADPTMEEYTDERLPVLQLPEPEIGKRLDQTEADAVELQTDCSGSAGDRHQRRDLSVRAG